jgi:hypothetical protein
MMSTRPEVDSAEDKIQRDPDGQEWPKFLRIHGPIDKDKYRVNDKKDNNRPFQRPNQRLAFNLSPVFRIEFRRGLCR